MHTTRMAAVAAAILLSVGTTAAQREVPPGGVLPPGNDAQLRDTPAVPGDAPLVPGSKDPTDRDLGEHQVTGKVESLDRQSGTLSIDVEGKDMKIPFPPTALQHLEKGDEVTVRLSLKKGSAERAATP